MKISTFIGNLSPYYKVYRVAVRGYKTYIFLKRMNMTEKGFLNEKREKRAARILDGLFNFKKIVGDKKVLWGLINAGIFLEKNDYKGFLWTIRLLDNVVLASQTNTKAGVLLDQALTLLENKDIDGFNDLVAGMVAGVVDIPLVDNDKQIFLSVLTLLKASINKFLAKINEVAALSEAEEKEE